MHIRAARPRLCALARAVQWAASHALEWRRSAQHSIAQHRRGWAGTAGVDATPANMSCGRASTTASTRASTSCSTPCRPCPPARAAWPGLGSAGVCAAQHTLKCPHRAPPGAVEMRKACKRHMPLKGTHTYPASPAAGPCRPPCAAARSPPCAAPRLCRWRSSSAWQARSRSSSRSSRRHPQARR